VFAIGNRDKDLQLIQRHTTIPCEVGARADHLVKANELCVSRPVSSDFLDHIRPRRAIDSNTR
jgi:hypothetical protein